MDPEKIEAELDALVHKALDSLARYKFWMFGYYASQWVKINQVLGLKKPNPFRALVILAKQLKTRADVVPVDRKVLEKLLGSFEKGTLGHKWITDALA